MASSDSYDQSKTADSAETPGESAPPVVLVAFDNAINKVMSAIHDAEQFLTLTPSDDGEDDDSENDIDCAGTGNSDDGLFSNPATTKYDNAAEEDLSIDEEMAVAKNKNNPLAKITDTALSVLNSPPSTSKRLRRQRRLACLSQGFFLLGSLFLLFLALHDLKYARELQGWLGTLSTPVGVEFQEARVSPSETSAAVDLPVPEPPADETDPPQVYQSGYFTWPAASDTDNGGSGGRDLAKQGTDSKYAVPTVEELFQVIEKAVAVPDATVNVYYDLTYGFPSRIYIKTSEQRLAFYWILFSFSKLELDDSQKMSKVAYTPETVDESTKKEHVELIKAKNLWHSLSIQSYKVKCAGFGLYDPDLPPYPWTILVEYGNITSALDKNDASISTVYIPALHNNQDLFGPFTTEPWDEAAIAYSYQEWKLFLWEKLPKNIKEAALVLGYDQQLWDNDQDLSIFSLTWDQLPTDQKWAAETLGCTEVYWDTYVWKEDKELDDQASQSQAETDPPQVYQSGYFTWPGRADNSSDTGERDLAVQSAENNHTVPTVEELFQVIEKALDIPNTTVTANYDLNYGFPSRIFIKASDNDPTFYWTLFSFSKLEPDSAPKTSTYTPEAINAFMEKKHAELIKAKNLWYSLSIQSYELKCAGLGDNNYPWTIQVENQQVTVVLDNNDNPVEDIYIPALHDIEDLHGSSVSVFSDGAMHTSYQDWNLLWWEELPKSIQEAALVLGYDEHLWDRDQDLSVFFLHWSELPIDQKWAAEALGYTEADWETYVYQEEEGPKYQTAPSEQRKKPPQRNGLDIVVAKVLAALCFAVVGTIDWRRKKQKYHLLMLLAGLFMTGTLLENEYFSDIFLSVSASFFFVEAFMIVRGHLIRVGTSRAKRIQRWLLLADSIFLLGALIRVLSSYLNFEKAAENNVVVCSFGVGAQVLWILRSFCYVMVIAKIKLSEEPEESTESKKPSIVKENVLIEFL
jgi:hypothetical protein